MKTTLRTTVLGLLMTSGLFAQDIPTAEDVSSIMIKLDRDIDEDKNTTKFKCRTEEWMKIRSELLPATEVPDPANWEVLGTATVVKNDGSKIEIRFWNPEEVDASCVFSVGDTYYRGDSHFQLLEALRLAKITTKFLDVITDPPFRGHAIQALPARKDPLQSALGHGGALMPLPPTHARLLDGRKLYTDAVGAVHVQISPGPVVRLTDELLPLTFSFPANKEEALEIAKFPHAGSVVPSEQVFNRILGMLDVAGFEKVDKNQGGIDSLVIREWPKNMKSGQEVTQLENGGFQVDFVAVVSSLSYMGESVKVRKFRYDFEKEGANPNASDYSEYDLVSWIVLNWQTMINSPQAEKAPKPKRKLTISGKELVGKMFSICGDNVLPPGRSRKRVGTVEYE